MTREGEKQAKTSCSFFGFNEEGVNAVFNWGIESYGVYSLAYYEAAQRLLQPILNSGNFADYDAYPILFLFRHYVELTLKEIIILTGRTAEIERTELPQFNIMIHNLATLLEVAEHNLELLKDTLGLEEEPFDKPTKELILDLSNFDQKSEAFRYPVDRRGNLFFSDHFLVGLPEVARNMEHIHQRLVGLTEYLTAAYDNARDMYS
jgi:hypothetical protein